MPLPDNEILRQLFIAKLTYLGNATYALMLWWVSSVIFIGSTLAGTYRLRVSLRKLPRTYVHIYFFFATAFVLSVVGFGSFMMYHVMASRKQAMEIALALGNVPLPTEYEMIFWGLVFGTSVFVGMTFMWVVLYYWVIKVDSSTTKQRDSHYP